MEIQINRTGQNLTVQLSGKLDTLTSQQFEKELLPELEEIQELILDMKDLTYVSSAGLRVILSCQKKMNFTHGQMIIKNVNELIMEIFETTGFDSILTIKNNG